MNDIYKTPLFTSWPNPFSAKSLRECFNTNKKVLKNKAKDQIKKLPQFSYFPNLSSLPY